MEGAIWRRWYTGESTCGEFYLGSTQECVTLERPWMGGANTPDLAAIPEGRYRVQMYKSPSFGMWLPKLMDVPGRSDILMHAGNWAKDVKGCIALGMGHGVDYISGSQAACGIVIPKIRAAVDSANGLWITVKRVGE